MSTLWLNREIFNRKPRSHAELPFANPPDSRLDVDDQMLWIRHNLELGLPVKFVSRKQLLRRHIVPATGDILAGTIDFVHAGLTSLGKPRPEIDYYPKALEPWFFRKIWKSTKKKVVERLEFIDEPVFVKPADKLKVFTGQVFHESVLLDSTPYKGNVWCSEPIQFISEWRVYVVDSKIRHMGFYGGVDEMRRPHTDYVNLMILALSNDPDWKWKNYCLDVGVLQNNAVALVEVGLGYAMGGYDIKGEDYYDMVKGWWNEATV
jgi:hypothetical protein